MGILYRTLDGDMLDDLCWRYYGRQSGAVEAVLDAAANRGLADYGPRLPAGVTVALIDLPAPPSRAPVRLWD